MNVLGELCDDGNQIETDGCVSGENAACVWAACGDGIVQPIQGEQCDDGNTVTETAFMVIKRALFATRRAKSKHLLAPIVVTAWFKTQRCVTTATITTEITVPPIACPRPPFVETA